jgi:hypothetical protein
MPAWLTTPPETTNAVWAWFLALFLIYMVARKAVALARGAGAPTTMARLADAATFAGSALLLSGILNPATLKAVGDTTGFLIIAGAGGLLYTGEQLIEEGRAPA